MVLLARKVSLFKEYDDATPMLLLGHVFNANSSISPILFYISNVL